MLLAEMQTYIREHRTVSLVDLELRFGTAPGALRDALALLERKGRVRRRESTAACGGCSGSACSGCLPTWIEWVREA